MSSEGEREGFFTEVFRVMNSSGFQDGRFIEGKSVLEVSGTCLLGREYSFKLCWNGLCDRDGINGLKTQAEKAYLDFDPERYAAQQYLFALENGDTKHNLFDWVAGARHIKFMLGSLRDGFNDCLRNDTGEDFEANLSAD